MSRTPRIRHMRYRSAERTRHSTRLNEWVAAQMERLAKTRVQIFNLLKQTSAQEVENLPDAPPPGP